MKAQIIASLSFLLAMATSANAEQVSVQAYVSGLAPQNNRYNTAKITAGYSNCFSPIGASFFIINTCGPALTTPGYYDVTGNFDHERVDGYRGDIPVVEACNPRMVNGPAMSTGACPTNYIGYNAVLPVEQSYEISSGQAIPWQAVPAPTPGIASGQLALDAPFSMPVTVFSGLRTPSSVGEVAQVMAPNNNNNNIAAAQVTTTTATVPAPAPYWFRVFPTASTVIIQPVPSPSVSSPYSPFFTSSSSNTAAAQIAPTPMVPAPAPYFFPFFTSPSTTAAAQIVPTPMVPAPAPYFPFFTSPSNTAAAQIVPTPSVPAPAPYFPFFTSSSTTASAQIVPTGGSASSSSIRCASPTGCFPGGRTSSTTASASTSSFRRSGKGKGMMSGRSRGQSSSFQQQAEILASSFKPSGSGSFIVVATLLLWSTGWNLF